LFKVNRAIAGVDNPETTGTGFILNQFDFVHCSGDRELTAVGSVLNLWIRPIAIRALTTF
jgi:hypothetical protein